MSIRDQILNACTEQARKRTAFKDCKSISFRQALHTLKKENKLFSFEVNGKELLASKALLNNDKSPRSRMLAVAYWMLNNYPNVDEETSLQVWKKVRDEANKHLGENNE